MAIPKIIHVCWWQSFDKLPEKFRPNLKSISDKNPGYNLYYWDEKSARQLMSQADPKYLAKLDEFQLLHQKVDFFRIFCLYVFGGISVDVDMVALKGFDNTPNINTSDFIVSYNNSTNKMENIVKAGIPEVINNAIILVSPRNPILGQLLDHILTLSCDLTQSKASCIQSTTGPNAFTKFLLDNYRDQITVLDRDYFESCSGNDDHCVLPEQAIIDHQHEGSWIPPFQKTLSRLYYHAKEYRIAIFGTIVALILLLVLTSKTKTN